MRELNASELLIAGGSFSEWETMGIAGVSSGLAFGAIEAYTQASVVVGVKFLVACSIPTAVIAGAIVAGVSWYRAV